MRSAAVVGLGQGLTSAIAGRLFLPGPRQVAPGPEQGQAIGSHLAQHAGTLFQARADLFLAELEHPRIVPRPAVDTLTQSVELGPPLAVVDVDGVRPDHEEIDVALLGHVTTSGRAEERGEGWMNPPRTHVGGHPGQELGTQSGKANDVRRGKVITIEGVDIGLPDPMCDDRPLADETMQRLADPALGVSPGELVNLPAGERPVGTSEYGQDIPVDARGDHPERSGQVHVSHYSTDIL